MTPKKKAAARKWQSGTGGQRGRGQRRKALPPASGVSAPCPEPPTLGEGKPFASKRQTYRAFWRRNAT